MIEGARIYLNRIFSIISTVRSSWLTTETIFIIFFFFFCCGHDLMQMECFFIKFASFVFCNVQEISFWKGGHCRCRFFPISSTWKPKRCRKVNDRGQYDADDVNEIIEYWMEFMYRKVLQIRSKCAFFFCVSLAKNIL